SALWVHQTVSRLACTSFPTRRSSDLVTTSGSWTSDWNLFGTSPESSAPAPKSGGSSRVALPVGDDGIEDAEVVEESADDILVGALRVMADAGSDRATREQLAARLTGGDEDALRIRMGKAGAGAPRSMRVGGQPVRGGLLGCWWGVGGGRLVVTGGGVTGEATPKSCKFWEKVPSCGYE